jgi:hypothetical protein
MTRILIELPESVAELVEQRAEALGTSSDQWASLMLTDLVADIPDGSSGPDEWISR